MASNVQKNVGNVGSDMILNQTEQQFQVVKKCYLELSRKRMNELCVS